MNLVDHDLVFRARLGSFEPLQREVADSDMTHHLFRYQTVERTHRLFQRDLVVDLMIKIQVKIIRAEPLQRVFRGAQHIIIGNMGFPDLGRQKQFAAVIAPDRLSNQLLRLAVRIGFRRVNQIEAQVQTGFQSLNLPGVVIPGIAFHTAAHPPCSHTENRH